MRKKLVALRNFFLSVSFIVSIQVHLFFFKGVPHDHLSCPMTGEVSLET